MGRGIFPVLRGVSGSSARSTSAPIGAGEKRAAQTFRQRFVTRDAGKKVAPLRITIPG
jgi:mevalonate pyrophosphate decarboxylase